MLKYVSNQTADAGQSSHRLLLFESLATIDCLVANILAKKWLPA